MYTALAYVCSYGCTCYTLYFPIAMAALVPKLEITVEGDDTGRTAQTAATNGRRGGSSSGVDQPGSNVRYGMSGM